MIKYYNEEMKTINPMIEYLEEKEYKEKIKVFQKMRMSDEEMKQTFSINPFILTMSNDDIYQICAKLKEVGIFDIAEVIYRNPQILNLIPIDIDKYIERKMKETSMSKEEIINDFEENPSDIND